MCCWRWDRAYSVTAARSGSGINEYRKQAAMFARVLPGGVAITGRIHDDVVLPRPTVSVGE